MLGIIRGFLDLSACIITPLPEKCFTRACLPWILPNVSSQTFSLLKVLHFRPFIFCNKDKIMTGWVKLIKAYPQLHLFCFITRNLTYLRINRQIQKVNTRLIQLSHQPLLIIFIRDILNHNRSPLLLPIQDPIRLYLKQLLLLELTRVLYIALMPRPLIQLLHERPRLEVGF